MQQITKNDFNTSLFGKREIKSDHKMQQITNFNTSLLDSPLFHQVSFVANQQGCSDTGNTAEQSFGLGKLKLSGNWEN